MIISFTRSLWCARCHRWCYNEPKAYAQIGMADGLLRGLTFRFRLCWRCGDEIKERMERAT
jgi:hypothetical protein